MSHTWDRPEEESRNRGNIARHGIAFEDAVMCHFEEESRPKIIRLHFVREELIAV